MSKNNYIQIDILCKLYQVEPALFERLDDIGLIQTTQVQSTLCVDEAHISQIDKILRLHHDLEINPEGIDVVMNLLSRIEALEQSLIEAKNRLKIHE